MNKLLIAISVSIAFFYATILYTVPKLTPKYSKLAKSMEEELYSYYNSHKKIPKLKDLSSNFIKAVKDANGISYSQKKGFSFRFDKGCPSNISFLDIISFGFYKGNSSLVAYSLDEKSIINNSNIRKQKK